MTDPSLRDIEIVDAETARAEETLRLRLSELWWTFVIRGVLAAAVGLAALFWPTDSIGLLLQLVGLLLVIDGGLTLFGFGRRGAAGIAGSGAVLIGLILLIWSDGLVRMAFFLLGAWALIIGVGSLITWMQMPKEAEQRSTVRNTAIASLAIGAVLVFWPGSGLVALGWAIAFAALTIAAVMFWLAANFRRAKTSLEPRDIT